MTDQKNIKTSIGRVITINLKQAIEWAESDEPFAFVCDTFDLYAHQLSTIERIERGLSDLLDLAIEN